MSSSNDLVANPRFLSPNVTYSINLIYKYLCSDKGGHVPLKYKLQEEKKYWTSCVAHRRGQWLITELYQFTSYQRKHEFSFEVVGRLHPDHFKDCLNGGDEKCDLFFLGIEFLPVAHEKDEHKVGMQPSMDLDTDWEKILPSDYAEIVKWSKSNTQWKNYKELYSLLREGFLIKTDVDKAIEALPVWVGHSKEFEEQNTRFNQKRVVEACEYINSHPEVVTDDCNDRSCAKENVALTHFDEEFVQEMHKE
ncbi:hypothetical protein Tco_1126374 [Tanacetum coccineum]